jgi:Asp-tRNA(Asn)/Glu-tRNA(Gln) amidotransferase A subunit family amidase
MMMAFDSTPPPARLDDETVAGLRVALARYIGDGDDSRELREALRRAAEEARAKGMRAEQLLIALKDVWHSLPALARLSRRDEQQRLLQRLITHCLDQYYAE